VHIARRKKKVTGNGGRDNVIIDSRPIFHVEVEFRVIFGLPTRGQGQGGRGAIVDKEVFEKGRFLCFCEQSFLNHDQNPTNRFHSILDP
jgi:hypothetical protein